MKINFREKEFKIWVILSILIVIVWSAVIWMLLDSRSENQVAFLEEELKRFEGEVNSTLITYEVFSNYIFDEIDQDQDIKLIMEEANYASEQRKGILRTEIYEKLHNKYQRMKKYGYRQLHFHLPNTESFLRYHAPDKYGDLLLDVRESVRLVSKNKEKVIGFEEGRIFNGFRYVYPIENTNYDYLGSVEISISSGSIIEVLSKLYSNEDFYFIIDKSAVEENVFEKEMTNYKSSSISEDYYVDKEVDEISTIYSKVVPESKEIFFKNLSQQFSEKLKDKTSFSVMYNFEGKNYTVKFSSIENLKKTPIAYLISISESVGYENVTKNMYEQMLLVTLLVFSIVAFGLVLSMYQSKTRKISGTDFLTGIFNRNKFYEIVKQEVRSSKRYNYDSSVMLMDIDHFKKINDTYGHDWGDQVLKELAEEILKNIRDADVFARWGGEEFVLLLPHTKKDEAFKVAEKLRLLIAESHSPKLKEVTISIGVAAIDPKNYDIDKAIKLADDAMYSAKRKGRNQVCCK